MLTQEKVMEILGKELPSFVSEYAVRRMGLFGSYAKGTPAKSNDMDILVELEKPMGPKFIDFAGYLEKLLGVSIAYV
jgi:hypothetical protein